MLIVARRKGQRIRIGNDIEVVVTELSRGEVRLGIVAPREVPVVREEIRVAVEAANRAAAGSDFGADVGAEGASVVTDLGAVKSAFRSSKDDSTRS